MRKIHINNDDNYATPPELYNELNIEFNFDFDPCPYCETNIVNDGLSIDWGKSNFVNPPYSQKLKEAFVLKGIAEQKKGKSKCFLNSCINFDKIISRTYQTKRKRNTFRKRKD